MIEVEEVDLDVTTFGDAEKQHIRYFLCGKGEAFSDRRKLGLMDACNKCEKRFVCATGLQ
jgi:hypothetical protein